MEEAARAAAEAAASPVPSPAPAPAPEKPVRASEPVLVSASAPVPDLAAAVSPARTRATSGGPARPRGSFLVPLLGVLALLLVAGGVLGAIALGQGPRLSTVQVDPAEAIEHSGSRVLLTANQALDPVDPGQVRVVPEVPFTVDASGRTVGVRFTVPLDDETEYTVTVSGVTGVGGGPAADLETRFTTPATQFYLLQRAVDGDDTIFRSDLGGENAVPVFSHPRIDDFRLSDGRLVVVVEEPGSAVVQVVDPATGEVSVLPGPGEGYIRSVQVSDLGGLVGYSYSDRHLGEGEGRASVLVTQTRDGGEPRIVEVGGEEASVAEWQFVPDSSAVLFIDFTGALLVEDLAGSDGPQALGSASAILGVSRGTYTAIVQRVDGAIVQLDLATGDETPLPETIPDLGFPQSVVPYPGGTLRHVVARDAQGIPVGQSIVRVDDGSATAEPLVEVTGTTAILQACASPSGRYTAVTIAPDLTANPYDDMLLPLPRRLETHIVDTATGEEHAPLSGFAISWCPMAPRR